MTADEAFAKIRILYAQLQRTKEHTPEYEQLVIAIKHLSDILNTTE